MRYFTFSQLFLDRIISFIFVLDFFFQDNEAKMQNLVDKLQSRVNVILKGGGEKAVARHTSRGKLVARDRIQKLLDPGTTFLELSQLAAFKLYGQEEVPAGGIITGIGKIRG